MAVKGAFMNADFSNFAYLNTNSSPSIENREKNNELMQTEKIEKRTLSQDINLLKEGERQIPQKLMESIIIVNEKRSEFFNRINIGIDGIIDISVNDHSFTVLEFPNIAGKKELFVSLANVDGKIGEGSYKNAYLGIQLADLNRDFQLVALTVDKENTDSNETRQEHAISSYLKNTLKIDGVFSAFGIKNVTVDGTSRACLVAPLCKGDYLDVREGKIQLTTEQKMTNAKKLLQSLGPIHDAGFTHNDIKADNIFIDKDNNAKIADWGTAKKYELSDGKLINKFTIECRSDKRKMCWAIYDTFTEKEKIENLENLKSLFAENKVLFTPDATIIFKVE